MSFLLRTAGFANSVKPYSLHWNFSLQYEAARNTVLELAYPGLRASRLEKRLSSGLNLLTNYTWSKNLEMNGTGGSSSFSQNGGTTFPVDSWNLRNEKAVGSLDVPHACVLSFG